MDVSPTQFTVCGAKACQSHYGVTGSMRSSWVRLSLFDELQSRATSGGNRSSERSYAFLGLDVHAETIAVAVAEPDGEVRSLARLQTGKRFGS
jgi:hypothetical protein